MRLAGARSSEVDSPPLNALELEAAEGAKQWARLGEEGSTRVVDGQHKANSVAAADDTMSEAGASESGVPPPNCVLACLDRFKGLIGAGTLSFLTAALFVLRSHALASSSCSTMILLWSEVLKLVFSTGMCIRGGNLHLATKSLLLACVPTVGYGSASLMAYWGMRHLDADTAALLSQIKLPASAVLSRICLGRRISRTRIFALMAILIGALGVQSFGLRRAQEEESQAADAGTSGSDHHTSRVPPSLFLLGTLAMVAVGVIASAMAVFLQWVFTDISSLWVRNVQFSTLSIPFFLISHLVSDATGRADCQTSLDTTGLIVAGCQATIGIVTALTLLWLGAIEKTLASVSALVITELWQAIWIQHAPPDLVQVMLALGIINGIVQFSVEK